MGFWVQIRPEVLARIREQYPVGCKVELLRMDDPYRKMQPGLIGTVTHVDDAGSIHVSWSNGSSLACLWGIDSLRRIDG